MKLTTNRSRKHKRKTQKPRHKASAATPPHITSYLATMAESDCAYAPYLMHDRSKADTWMAMYWGDYFKDTQDLTCLEHGAYCLLIGNYWINRGPLADDNARLARITKLSLRQWLKVRVRIAKFFQIKDGFWHHKRIDKEMAKAIENRERRSKSGRAAANARWYPECDRIAEGPATPVRENAPVPSPSPTPLTRLVVQAQEAPWRREEPILEHTTEQQLVDHCYDLFGKDFMARHGGSWRLRARENPGKLIRVLRELRAEQREGKHIRHAGAYANDLWTRFSD